MAAALCAGSVFVVATVASTGAEPSWSMIGPALFILPLASLFGFVLAIVPCLIGSYTLHALGTDNFGVRLPPFWALVGALVAGGAIAATGAQGEIVAAFAATGAVSALICRSGARWT